MGCHGKGKADVHARRIAFDRSVQKFFHTGKIHDLIEFTTDFCPAHTKDGAIEEDIFPSCELGMKPRAYFQQAGYTSAQSNLASAGLSDAGKKLEQCGFSRTVAADDADSIPRHDVEADILESPEFFLVLMVTLEEALGQLEYLLAQRTVSTLAFMADSVFFPQAFDRDDGFHKYLPRLRQQMCALYGEKF